MKKAIYWALVLSIIAVWSAILTTDGNAKSIDFPTKPIQIIVPYPAGGGMDVVARIIGKHASKHGINKIVVINKPGGGGSIGTNEIARSNPDGYTTGLIAPSTLTSQFTIPDCPFTYKDFTPLVEVTEESHALIVKKSLKMDFKQFIDYVKKNPQKASISIGGEWNSHDFFRAKLEKFFGIKFLRIPYQGGAPALQAVAGGHVDSSTPFISEGLPLIEGNMVTAIAISGTERASVLPNIPTIKEIGYNLDHVSWRGLALPVGVPQEIIGYLDGVFSKTMKDPELIKDFAKAGIYARLRSHKEFVRYYMEEYEQYSTLLKELGFKVK